MLAIIPARGGSKGLPGKNIRPLAGVPLIGHTIRAALAAKHVTRVVVSTDDVHIAEIARAEGAEVPFLRPQELATDTALAIDAFLYTVDRIHREQGETHNSFVALSPTSPLRQPADIDAALALYEERHADSVISVAEAPVPIQWYLRIDANGVLSEYLSGAKAIGNRQDHGNAFVPNGSIYVLTTELVRARRVYYTERTFPFIMPRERSVDIDGLLDFEWAEFLLRKRESA